MRSAAKISAAAGGTRQTILKAAAELFGTKGFRATTISDIAARAKVNRALISYHFGSKSGLYGELLGEAVNDAAEALGDLRVDLSAPDPERQLIRAFADAYGARLHLAPMLLREHLDPSYLVDAGASGKLRGFFDLTRQVLATLEMRPEARAYDPQIVHLICVGSLIYFLVTDPYRERMQVMLDPPPTRPHLDEFVSVLSDFLKRALRD